jgi:hypothetical protein
MGIPHQLRVRTKKSWSEIPALTGPSPTNGSDGQVEIPVLFTSPKATIGAIERTAPLLNGLNARINLIAVQVVPYTLALNNPPVFVAFNEQRLFDLARESPIETIVHLYVCRGLLETITSVVKSGSVLIIGTRRRWWPTWERKLAKQLSRSGLDVVLLEAD